MTCNLESLKFLPKFIENKRSCKAASLCLGLDENYQTSVTIIQRIVGHNSYFNRSGIDDNFVPLDVSLMNKRIEE